MATMRSTARCTAHGDQELSPARISFVVTLILKSVCLLIPWGYPKLLVSLGERRPRLRQAAAERPSRGGARGMWR